MNAPTNRTEYLNGLRAAERRRATLSRMTGDEPAYLTMKKDLSRITSNY